MFYERGTPVKREGGGRGGSTPEGAKPPPLVVDIAASLPLAHRRPYVGVSHARSWSRLLVLGAILWAFIAKT